MLIVCNGAYKSGSTWIFNIVRAITNFPAPPKEFLEESWVLPSLRVTKLDSILDKLDYQDKNYLVKNHIGNRGDRGRLFSRKDVVVINVERDLKDVLVSAYYHSINVDGFSGDFSKWYSKEGQEVMDYVIDYQNVWKINNENYYKTHYEDLVNNIRGEIAKLGRYFGIEMTPGFISEVIQKTSFKKLKTADKSFFRKGKIGDWVNHFDTEMLLDFERNLLNKTQ